MNYDDLIDSLHIAEPTRELCIKAADAIQQMIIDRNAFKDVAKKRADVIERMQKELQDQKQEHFRDITKKVEPLTLDDLRQMDGEPVWVQSPGVPEYGRWAIVEGVGENCLFLHDDFTCHEYSKTWLAYRQKLEEETL